MPVVGPIAFDSRRGTRLLSRNPGETTHSVIPERPVSPIPRVGECSVDASTLGVVSTGLTGLGLLIRQFRIGLRDRGDRKGMINAPYIAPHLVELRSAQSPAGIIQRRKPLSERQSVPPQDSIGDEEVSATPSSGQES